MTPILTYHSVGEVVPPRFDAFVVSPQRFREQLRALQRDCFTTLTVSQMMRYRAANIPIRAAVITFDDGFADFLTEALPALLEFNMTATLFVTSGLMGRRFWNLPMLMSAELREIQRAGIEIGGHTITHPQLDRIAAVKLREEVVGCKHQLEDWTGCEIESFAYPFGFYNQRVRQAVIKAGYKSACAVRYGWSDAEDDRYALHRLIVRPNCRTPHRPHGAGLFYYRLRSQGFTAVRRVRNALGQP